MGAARGREGEGGYHFKVTWPFWTRLVLNPIVGMELSPRERERRKAMGFDTLGYSYAWTINLLYSEFPTLRESVSDGTATATATVKVGQQQQQQTTGEKERRGKERRGHTAKTRSKEDFPAFCRPIMVTSISVALQGFSRLAIARLHLRGRRGNGPGGPFPDASTAHSYQNILRSQS